MSEQPPRRKRPDPKKYPWIPPEAEIKVVQAFKDLSKGQANEDQQLLAFDHLIHTLCEIGGLSYRPDSDRDTVFAEGKRFVALQIVNYIQRNSKPE